MFSVTSFWSSDLVIVVWIHHTLTEAHGALSSPRFDIA